MPFDDVCQIPNATLSFALGAVLQQSQPNGEWKPTCFASRFLPDYEAKYSINELELLAIVWAVEHFRNYVYGVQFKILSDHKALMSVLKPNGKQLSPSG